MPLCLLWLSYVAIKRPARDGTLSLLQPQRWEQSLTDIHHPLPADSLIPMFESMVDRALIAYEPAAAVCPSRSRAEADRIEGASRGCSRQLQRESLGLPSNKLMQISSQPFRLERP